MDVKLTRLSTKDEDEVEGEHVEFKVSSESAFIAVGV